MLHFLKMFSEGLIILQFGVHSSTLVFAFFEHLCLPVLGHHAVSLRYYLEAAIVVSDFFSQPLPRAAIDDHVYKRMIKCCTHLQCHTQVIWLQCPSGCIFICIYIYMSVYPSIYWPTYLPIYIHPPTSLYVHPSICLSIYVSISVHSSIWPPVR